MSSTEVTSPSSQSLSTPRTFPSSTEDLALEQPTIVSTQRSLSKALHARRAEFIRPYQIRLKVGTWNVAALSGTDKDIGAWFVDGDGVSDEFSALTVGEESEGRNENLRGWQARAAEKGSAPAKNGVGTLPGRDEIGLYVLGLQEIVDITSTTETLRPYLFSDPHAGNKWKQAIEKFLPPGYQLVAEQQLIGLYLVVYASPSVAPTVSSVSTTSVGTGIWHHGNKGAVAARLVLGETTRVVFVNCHLAAGTGKLYLQRRNEDAAEVAKQVRFKPVDSDGVLEDAGDGLGEEDFTFWFGDLNYRLDSMPGEDVRRLLMLHTQNKYQDGQETKTKVAKELSNSLSEVVPNAGGDRILEDDRLPSSIAFDAISSQSSSTLMDPDSEDPMADPYSLQTTLSSLLPHDELHAQMHTGKAFGGWREGPIRFLPTYKYDVGSVGIFDSSEKQRGPSWCDRILYRTRKDILRYERKRTQEKERYRRDEEMKARGVDELVAGDQAVFFDYDPETDGAQDAPDTDVSDVSGFIDSDAVSTNSGSDDRLELEYYTSYQRIISSDHKPLDAVFTLIYDAVDSKLKARIHMEVVRELDKAENEGRPAVTVVVDHYHDDHEASADDPSSKTVEGVDFGEVKYDRKKTRHISIANTGKVPATIEFVDRSSAQGEPTGIAPPWLGVYFDSASIHENSDSDARGEYTLQPGEVANVKLVLHVKDTTLVRHLNHGSEDLEDILVLRIHNGRDYFLPLRGTWAQSTFGRSVDKLIRIPEGGVRSLLPQRHGDRHGNDGVKWSAPRELFRLTDAIEEFVERSMAEWEMKSEQGNPPWGEAGWPFTAFSSGGTEKDVLKGNVWEGLDTGQDFRRLFPPEAEALPKLEAVSEVLLRFLESLEDGIIPQELWMEIEKGMLENERSKKPLTKEEERNWVLEILSSSSAHSTSFTLITFMLARVANETAPVQQGLGSSRSSSEITGRSGARASSQDLVRRNEVDGALATIFAKAMIRAPTITKEKERKASESKKKTVVELFLRAQWDDNTP